MIEHVVLPFDMIGKYSLDEKGSTALEAALIFPILFALIFTIVDIGRLLITDSLLQTALGSFSRNFRFPSADEAHSLTYDHALFFIKKNLDGRASGWIEEEKLSLTITAINDPSLGGCSEEKSTCSLVELVYPFSTTIPVAGLLFGDDVLLRKSVVYVINNMSEVGS